MTRLLSSILAVVVLVAAGLLAFWLLGHLLRFLGVFIVGLVSVLAGLLWYLLLAALLGGVVYFVTSAYRRT